MFGRVFPGISIAFGQGAPAEILVKTIVLGEADDDLHGDAPGICPNDLAKETSIRKKVGAACEAGVESRDEHSAPCRAFSSSPIIS